MLVHDEPQLHWRVREFRRDVLELESVDAAGGWHVFASPPAELAGRPTDEQRRHELYLTSEITEQGFGLMTAFAIPGGGELAPYGPNHLSPLRASG